jgi:hypothetical protein
MGLRFRPCRATCGWSARRPAVPLCGPLPRTRWCCLRAAPRRCAGPTGERGSTWANRPPSASIRQKPSFRQSIDPPGPLMRRTGGSPGLPKGSVHSSMPAVSIILSAIGSRPLTRRSASPGGLLGDRSGTLVTGHLCTLTRACPPAAPTRRSWQTRSPPPASMPGSSYPRPPPSSRRHCRRRSTTSTSAKPPSANSRSGHVEGRLRP